MRYADRRYQLRKLIDSATDDRVQPVIKTPTMFGGVIIMMAARLGSLNALEENKQNRFWKRWLGAELPSPDSVGRVYSHIHVSWIRKSIHHVYTRMKRNKVLMSRRGFNVLIVDGHESHASYFRCCPGCLERVIHTKQGDRTQYYHREVIALLTSERFPLVLDIEEQRKGEDEVATALRLMKRVLEHYPRAFDMVAADGFYLKANFFRLIQDKGKDVMAVLKDERRDLMKDARGLFKHETSRVDKRGKTTIHMWDIESFTSWRSLGRDIRVVRSLETTRVRRQHSGEIEEDQSEWIWATTASRQRISTESIITMGHERWLVENKAINEMVTYWHANHVYKHHPQAIIAFWLTLMLVLNLFRAFVNLNIKPQVRKKHSDLYFAGLIFAGLHETLRQEVPP